SAEIALSADDVVRIARAGKKAILLGLEGGHATGGRIDDLHALYDAGVRYVGLTHINSNSFADASQAPPRWNGLNDTGRAFVREMNRIGMLVDLSHASDSTFWDVISVSTAPVILSHSSARALVDNVRNVSDDMLRAVADNGGIVMVNFFDPVVNSQLTDDVMEEVYRRAGGRAGRLHDLWSVVYQVRRERGIGSATITDVVDHIDHVARVAGVDHVGLGSDFDGVFDLPSGLQDVTRLPWITYELLKRGYSEEDLYKILGGNIVRVMTEVEK
ncbi:MAG: dipeptidase, partial [Bacteroidota bacterium]